METIEEYLDNLSTFQKTEYNRIRKIVKTIVPEAKEVISYRIPTFKYKNKRLLFFGAFKDHISIYPTSDSMISKIGKGLGSYRTSKGTLQYSESNPMSDQLIKEIVGYRLKDIFS